MLVPLALENVNITNELDMMLLILVFNHSALSFLCRAE